MEDYLEKCEPEEAEVCLRYVLKHAERLEAAVFSRFSAPKRRRTILWQAGGIG